MFFFLHIHLIFNNSNHLGVLLTCLHNPERSLTFAVNGLN